MENKKTFNNSNGKSGPCKGCTKRYVGCHGKCLDYIDWKQKHDIEAQEIRDAKEFEQLTWSPTKRKCSEKIMRKGGFHGHNSSR